MPASYIPHYSPLLVRSPNLNAWLPLNSTDGAWPVHWLHDNKSLGLGGLIRIDGVSLPWMGIPISGAGTPGFEEQTMTPTSTVRKFKTNGVDFNVTFLSPIEPEDIILQSFPFSYISVDVKSNDGHPHSVQIFLDMQGQWLSYDSTTLLSISAEPGQNITFLQGAPANLAAMPMKVIERHPEDVTLYFGMATEPSSTYQVGSDAREGFIFQGQLNNTGDEVVNQTLVDGTNLVSFSLSKDLGDIGTDTVSNALFAVGLVRDPSISFAPSPGSAAESRPPCFRTVYDRIGPALEAFITGFSSARDRAAAFDERITNAAREVSDEVADLVAVTTRTVMASMDITCGSSDASEVMFFVNGMGSTHESNSPHTASYANRVEDLYASWPAIMFINATYGRYMLEPLLTFQANGSQAYALPDLGQTYPVVNGGEPSSDIAVQLGVEESGNMLLMAWAQARYSGESVLVDKYYDVFKRWADYIPDHIPGQGTVEDLASADGKASSNANLALKGILGVRAMAELAAIKMETSASQDYFSKSQVMYQDWIKTAFSGDHMILDSVTKSWGLMYNMYADKWLGLRVVSEDIHKQQERFYASKPVPEYGMPYDFGTRKVKPHWTAFTAVTAEGTSLRDTLMQTIHKYVFDSKTPFIQNTYVLDANGKPMKEGRSGAISSTYGSMFAIQARSLPVRRQVQFNTSVSDGAGDPFHDSTHKPTDAGAIAGGVVGGVAAILLAVILFMFRRRRQNKLKQPALSALPHRFDIGSEWSQCEGAVGYLQTPQLQGAPRHSPALPLKTTATFPQQPRQDTPSGPRPLVESNLGDAIVETYRPRNTASVRSTNDPPPPYQ